MKLDRTRFLVAFFATLFVAGWAPLALLLARGQPIHSPLGRAALVFQAFGPLLATVVCTGLAPHREGVLASLGLSFRPNLVWLLAWTLPLLQAAVALGLCSVAGAPPITTAEALAAHVGARGTPIEPLTLLAMALPAGLTINFLPSLAAEVGFRGFLFREAGGAFGGRALRVGIVEAVFIVPTAMLGWGFPESPLVGGLLVAVHTMLASFLVTMLRVRGESVFPVALYRATNVALLHPSIDLVPHAADWLRPPFGLTGVIATALALAAFLVHDRYFAARKVAFARPRVGSAPT